MNQTNIWLVWCSLETGSPSDAEFSMDGAGDTSSVGPQVPQCHSWHFVKLCEKQEPSTLVSFQMLCASTSNTDLSAFPYQMGLKDSESGPVGSFCQSPSSCFQCKARAKALPTEATSHLQMEAVKQVSLHCSVSTAADKEAGKH